MRYATLLTLLLFAGSLRGQVTSDNIWNASREPQNWLTYSGATPASVIACSTRSIETMSKACN